MHTCMYCIALLIMASDHFIYIQYTASSSYNNFALLTALNSEDLGYAVSNQLGGTSVLALMKLRNFYMSCMRSNTSNFQFSLMKFLSKTGEL